MEIVLVVITVVIIGGLIYGCVKFILDFYYNASYDMKNMTISDYIRLIGKILLFIPVLAVVGFLLSIEFGMLPLILLVGVPTLLLSILIPPLLMYGFSYIVEAACLYIEKQGKEEENEANE